jgi:hypothetical protein
MTALSAILRRQFNGVPNLDGVPDQATSPLDKGEFVCETALQKHAYAKVSCYVGHCDQRHVLGQPSIVTEEQRRLSEHAAPAVIAATSWTRPSAESDRVL